VAFLLKGAPVRNTAFFNYFKKYLEIQQVNCATKIPETPPFVGLVADVKGKFTHQDIAYSFIQKKWKEEKKGPLFQLRNEDHEHGKKYLHRLGFPENSWYVCFHMREPGYRDGGSKAENFRNVDPSTYYDAMQEVVRRGGYVFRMGDPSMTPLPKMEGVIDYAHSEDKSDLLDVFLCASCDFIVATSSGVANIPRCFGVPALTTNIANYCGLYSLPIDSIYLPRLMKQKNTGKYLDFEVMLGLEINIMPSSFIYESKGFTIIDNTAEEILMGVRDMFDKKYLANHLNNDETNRQKGADSVSLQASRLYGDVETEIAAKIAPSFLLKYNDLLLSEYAQDRVGGKPVSEPLFDSVG
jgi:putative glycosyltransferase (TIGR04372 family)